MDVRKTIWLYVLLVVLVVVLCSVFLSQIGGKNAGHEMEAIDEQNKKLAEQDKRFAGQDKRLTELERMARKIDEIQAALNTRKVDIKDDDMSLIKEIIEEQVKLNVRSGDRPKIGVVSIQRILENSKKRTRYGKEALAQENKVAAELEKLSKEIEADDAGLKTLKPGSSDYLALLKKRLEKQATYQAKKEFHERQWKLEDRRWHEELYKEVLQITSELAEQKGLDLVLEDSEPELPTLSTQELALAIQTHKLLYSGSLLDITDEVMARFDSKK